MKENERGPWACYRDRGHPYACEASRKSSICGSSGKFPGNANSRRSPRRGEHSPQGQADVLESPLCAPCLREGKISNQRLEINAGYAHRKSTAAFAVAVDASPRRVSA